MLDFDCQDLEGNQIVLENLTNGATYLNLVKIGVFGTEEDEDCSTEPNVIVPDF